MQAAAAATLMPGLSGQLALDPQGALGAALSADASAQSPAGLGAVGTGALDSGGFEQILASVVSAPSSGAVLLAAARTMQPGGDALRGAGPTSAPAPLPSMLWTAAPASTQAQAADAVSISPQVQPAIGEQVLAPGPTRFATKEDDVAPSRQRMSTSDTATAPPPQAMADAALSMAALQVLAALTQPPSSAPVPPAAPVPSIDAGETRTAQVALSAAVSGRSASVAPTETGSSVAGLAPAPAAIITASAAPAAATAAAGSPAAGLVPPADRAPPPPVTGTASGAAPPPAAPIIRAGAMVRAPTLVTAPAEAGAPARAQVLATNSASQPQSIGAIPASAPVPPAPVGGTQVAAAPPKSDVPPSAVDSGTTPLAGVATAPLPPPEPDARPSSPSTEAAPIPPPPTTISAAPPPQIASDPEPAPVLISPAGVSLAAIDAAPTPPAPPRPATAGIRASIAQAQGAAPVTGEAVDVSGSVTVAAVSAAAASDDAGQSASDRDGPGEGPDRTAPAPQPAPQPVDASAAAGAMIPAALAQGQAAGPVKANGQTVSRLAADIVQNVKAKASRFQLELAPAGLGRVGIDVRVGADGALSASLSFDNPQAAEALKAHAGELREALQQAGFTLSGSDLSFTAGGSDQEPRQGQGQPSPSSTYAAPSSTDPSVAPAAAIPSTASPSDGLDIRI